MHEAFIHYIWQFQYFNRNALTTSEGENIEVLKQGILNNHAGPDFANAKVKIDGIDWAGSVEIHTKSSEWFEHHHDQDVAYEQVVLHVVWKYDKPVYRADKTLLPTLELKDRVDGALIQEYKKLINNPSSIPCKKSFSQVAELIKLFMLDKSLMQRLETKSTRVIEILNQNKNDWQETAYQVLAGNFGFKVNSDSFFNLARALPYKILLKHADQPVQVEALLFGQAGLLDVSVGDAYYRLLQREYDVLSKKYKLAGRKLSKVQWRFMRMRPANFPTVRIAQFAALLIQRKNLFSTIFEVGDFYSLRKSFSIIQSEYWQSHYQFNRETKQRVADLGDSSVDNILINSVAPLLVAYGKYTDKQQTVDYAVNILEHVSAENNAIIKIWKKLGYTAKTAFDSQALIELYNQFCQKRNCLNCAIGASLLKPKP